MDDFQSSHDSNVIDWTENILRFIFQKEKQNIPNHKYVIVIQNSNETFGHRQIGSAQYTENSNIKIWTGSQIEKCRESRPWDMHHTLFHFFFFFHFSVDHVVYTYFFFLRGKKLILPFHALEMSDIKLYMPLGFLLLLLLSFGTHFKIRLVICQMRQEIMEEKKNIVRSSNETIKLRPK